MPQVFPSYASGQAAAGTLFQIGNAGSPESFHSYGRIGNINGPQASTKEVETTAHSNILSDGRIFDSWVPTVISGGKISFDLFIKTDNNDDRQLMSYFLKRTIFDTRIVEPDSLNSVLDFQAFFTAFKLDHPVAGVVKATCELRCTGTVYFFE